MRQRVKINGLVSHTKPTGQSYTSKENKCRMGINKLQKLLDEGYEISGIKKKEETNEAEFKIVMVFGKPMKLTIQEYNDHWNFRVDK